MKIESGKGVSSASNTRRAGDRAGATGFSVPAEDTPRAAAAAPMAAVTLLDAVIALQTEEPPARRRARQARRGREVLDALEKLEEGLLLGRAPAALKVELERLRRGTERTGEPGLDDVMREIDTRLEVELAKLERMAGAA